MELSLVVPCFNEEGNLAALVNEARAVLERAVPSYEIVAVDDGSADGTSALLERLSLGRSDLRPLHHERNRGMGAAVRTGIAAARGDLVLIIPGDNQFPLDQIPAMLSAAQDADIVVGERASAYATTGRSLPSWLYSLGMRALFGLHVRGEVNLYRRSAIEGVGTTSDGFFGNTELLIRVLRRNARCVAHPVRFRERAAGRPTGRDPRRMLEVVRETMAFFFRLQWERLRR